jgi:hypothetical protein
VRVKCKFEAFGPYCSHLVLPLYISVFVFLPPGDGAVWDRFPVTAKIVSTASRSVLGPTQSLCPRIKRPERESDDSLPSTAEVKNV